MKNIFLFIIGILGVSRAGAQSSFGYSKVEYTGTAALIDSPYFEENGKRSGYFRSWSFLRINGKK